MSKSTRFTPQALEAMGLEPDGQGGYRKKSEPKREDPLEIMNLLETQGVMFQPETKRLKVYVGIDPGKSGAICVINGEGLFEKYPIPILGKDIDAQELYNILKRISEVYNPVVVLEDVHSIYGTGAASNFTFGFVCGMIRAMVIANSIPLHMIAPKAWQKIIWSNDDKVYKPIKPNQKRPQLDTKATSLRATKRMFPVYDLRKNERSRIPHDGIVDGLLLAEYGRRLNL